MQRRAFLAAGAYAALARPAERLWGSALQALPPAPPMGTSLASLLTTPCGTLRGESVHGVRVFRGVPFAEPPRGPLRFKPPMKKKRWTGERDATAFAAAAMQSDDVPGGKSEDCLYLNVWAPQDEAPGLPVFVWIHGGGFTAGRPTEPIYDGTAFAREGVIVVTVAYRLGAFGFLDVEPSLGKEYAGSANNGLRDLICALEWVRDNIAAFGGDPSAVTVGGESAGAKLTDILLGVPAAQGLFASAISESGGAERVWPATQAAAIGKAFAAQLSGGGDSLHTMAAADLIAAQTKFLASWPQHFPLRPQVDGVLLPRLPVAAIAAGRSAEQMPPHRGGKRLLIGTNREESALFIGPHPVADATAKDLGNVSPAAFAAVFAKYKAIYPDLSPELLRIRALTAEEYWVPSVRVADAVAAAGGEVWMYRLDFAYSSGRYKGLAFHSEDVGLVWDKPDTGVDNAAAVAALARQVHAAWVAFIKGEEPKANGLPVWPSYSSASRQTMVLDTVSRVEQRPLAAELALWEGVL